MIDNQKRCETAIETLRPLTARMNAVLAQLPPPPLEIPPEDRDAALRGSMLNKPVLSTLHRTASARDHTVADPPGRASKQRPKPSSAPANSRTNARDPGDPTGPTWRGLEKMIDELSCSSIGEDESYVSASLPELYSKNGAAGPHTPKLLKSRESTMHAIQEMSALPEALLNNKLVTDHIPELSSDQLAECKSSAKRARVERPSPPEQPTKRLHPSPKNLARDRESSAEPQPTPQSVPDPLRNQRKMKSTNALSESFLKLKQRAQNSLQAGERDLYPHVAMGAVNEGIQWARAKEYDYRQKPESKSRADAVQLLDYLTENFLKKTEKAFRENFPNEARAKECAEVREKLQLRSLLLARFHPEQKRALAGLRDGLKALSALENIRSTPSALNTITKTVDILADFDKAIEIYRRLTHSDTSRPSVQSGAECTIN